jgi:hypothetical protein
MSADIDDMTLIKIQEQIAAVGNGVTELRAQFSNMDAKLDRFSIERQAIVQRLVVVEQQLVPKDDIKNMFDRIREIEPFLKFFRWSKGVFVAAFAVFLTGIFVAMFIGIKTQAEITALDTLRAALIDTQNPSVVREVH